MYHRYAASKRTFTYVDHRIFRMVWRWCRRRHPKKSREVDQGRPISRADGHRHWVFTGTLRDQKGQGWPIQLMAAAKVKIIRYVKIRSAVNPYDPKWELYLEARLGLATGPDAGRSAGGSNTSGRNKRDDAWPAVNRCGWRRRTARSTIASGAAEAVGTRRTTWSCSMPTAIGRSTCKKDGPKRPRPARGVREGLSWMRGNSHVHA